MGTLEGAGSRRPEVRQWEGVNSIWNLPIEGGEFGTKSTCLCSRVIGKVVLGRIQLSGYGGVNQDFGTPTQDLSAPGMYTPCS
jgi:hypothetical protein